MCTFESKLVIEADPKTGEVTRRTTKTGKRLVDCGKKDCKTSDKYQIWWVLCIQFTLDLAYKYYLRLINNTINVLIYLYSYQKESISCC